MSHDSAASSGSGSGSISGYSSSAARRPSAGFAPAVLSKPCCVVGCGERREKEGYCLTHFRLFKAPDPAAQKAEEKRRKEMDKMQQKMKKEAEQMQRRASAATMPAASGRGGASGNNPSWWQRRSSTLQSGCFSAPCAPPEELAAATASTAHDSALLEALRSAWSNAHKVVFKDLPRLAKRTTVETEQGGSIVESGREVQRTPPPAIPASPSPSSTSSSASQPAPDLSFPPTRPVPAPNHRSASIGSWTSWAGMENENWSGKEFVRRRNAELQREGERRLAALQSQSPDTALAASPSPTASSSPDDIDAWNAACNCVLGVVSQLESESTLRATRDALLAASSSLHAGSDHQLLLEDLFTRVVGLDSRSFRVFQAVHQSILFPAIAQLHEALYARTPGLGHMKDVRRPDGWTVHVFIGAAVYVTHQRWEQSLHPASDPRHVEVRWSLRLSFDLSLSALRAAFLRVEELRFADDAEEEWKQTVTRVMAGAGYIV